MATPIDNLRIDGERLDARVEANLAGGELLRTMDGASTLTLEIHDPQGEILETGVLSKAKSRGDTFGDAAWTRLGKVQCTIDGSFFRISGVQKTGSRLTLTFEDEIVALLRSHTRAIRSSRADGTRAQFISRLLSTVKERKIISWIPAEYRTQHIKRPEVEDTKVGQSGIPKGSHITIKDVQADAEQIRNLNIILGEAAALNCTERVTLAMIQGAISESSVRAVRNQGNPPSPYWGVFQGNINVWKRDDTDGMARAFLEGGKGFQAGGAIKAAAANPSWSTGRIVLAVEGSVSNFGSITAGEAFYNTYKDEAETILEAYGGTGKIVRTRERYVYRAGSHGKGADREREDYWQAIERLAEEVNWRAFTANNVFFYAADNDLLRAQTAMTVAEQPSKKEIRNGVQYVGNLDFDWHYNKPVGEVTFTIAAERWLAYPGSITDIRGLGPCEGRWINWQFRQALDSSEMDITLHRPAPAKPEPSATVKSTPVSQEDAAGTDLLRWAKTQLGTQEGSAKQVSYAASLGLSASLPWCSIFIAYGLKKVSPRISLPANPAYSGAWLGWTGAKHVAVTDLKPGDIVVFDWGDGGRTDHVAIFAGNGSVIGGNQGNAVTTTRLNTGAVVGAVRIRNE